MTNQIIKESYMIKREVELLAPAGSIPAFISAIENGADAVYIGGNAFNARMGADNFDDDTMQHAIDYAHLRSVKVFVTMNTLIKDEELEKALYYAKFLYEAGADALIIQDIGLGYLIRKHLPDFELHFSTQGTTYESYALDVLELLGYKRVVLSRELSIDEIREINKNRVAQIEVFIHGAICISYSGQCQLSRRFGGRSGNRGRCAQSCRLRYNVGNHGGDSFYALSSKDMCQIENIGELIDAGVYSFKIEGRMKSPEYVGIVTKIYRKYIDLYLKYDKYSVSKEDREALLQIFNRGGFTEGFLHGDPKEGYMSEFIPKNNGVYLGKVISKDNRNSLCKVNSILDISMHDGIEIRKKNGDIVSSGIITYLSRNTDGTYIIGDVKNNVSKRDVVFRTSSSRQLEDVRKTFKNIDIFSKECGKNTRKLKVNMELVFDKDRLTLTCSTKNIRVSVYSEGFTYSKGSPSSLERYLKSLSKTGNTPFVVSNIEFKGDYDIKARTSEINELRRVCIDELSNKLKIRRKTSKFKIKSIDNEESYISTENFTLFHTIDEYLEYKDKNIFTGTALLPLAELSINNIKIEDDYIPYISAVSKGKEDEILEGNYLRCLKICREKGALAGNLGWLVRLAHEGIKVIADYGLNAYNLETVRALKDIGAYGVVKSLESGDLDGRNYPLMITEHNFQNKNFTSYKNNSLEVVKRPYSSQDIIIEK